MQIINKKVKDLIPYAKNAKKHEQKQIDGVAKSIEQFGFVQPVVIDKNNEIVIGHCRVLASKKLGLKEVPCVCVDELTDEQVKALRLADNKLNESEWDFALIDEELASIVDIDMSELGFDVANISPDDFGEDFSLPDGDKSEIEQMTFTLHHEQAELIKYCMGLVKDDVQETFGNTNSNGNALYEVVRQWAEQRK